MRQYVGAGRSKTDLSAIIMAEIWQKKEIPDMEYFKILNLREDAYRFWRKYPENAPPVRIIPYWNRRDGLGFAVILKEAFADERSAQRAIKKLPPSMVSGSSIITQWEDDTLFFTELMQRGDTICQNLRTGP
jgi:hypothetical protein